MKSFFIALILASTLAFGCPPTPPKPKPQPTPVIAIENVNTNSNSNTNNNTNTVYTNQSQAQSQAQNQSQTATGGNASSTSTGGNAVGNGDNSNNSITNVAAPKIPVNTAYAPSAFPTVPCFKGFGGGAQVAQAGVSFGGGKIDPNCAILETARSLILAGSRPAYCQVMATDKYVKAAYGKNIQKFIDDCMYEPPQPPQPPQPLTQTPPQPIVVQIEPALVKAEVTEIPAPIPTPTVVPVPPVVIAPIKKAPTVKKAPIHHFPPECQNTLEQFCEYFKHDGHN